MAMDHTPIFVVATPQAFRDFQLATAPDPATGKPDPARTADFLAHHPETRAFMDWMRDAPLPSSFANGSYFSFNAFRFINQAGETRHVRWSLVSETPFEALDKSRLADYGADFQFQDAVERLRQGPLPLPAIPSTTPPRPGRTIAGRSMSARSPSIAPKPRRRGPAATSCSIL